MELITKKSQCTKNRKNVLIKSPKEAIRRTLKNYLIKDGYIVKAYEPYTRASNDLIFSEELRDSFSMAALAN
jgi:hypothetical protein